MEGHQEPWIALGDPTLLEEGMTFSMEPGLFNPEGGYGYNPSDCIMVAKDKGSRHGERSQPDQGVGAAQIVKWVLVATRQRVVGWSPANSPFKWMIRCSDGRRCLGNPVLSRPRAVLFCGVANLQLCETASVQLGTLSGTRN